MKQQPAIFKEKPRDQTEKHENGCKIYNRIAANRTKTQKKQVIPMTHKPPPMPQASHNCIMDQKMFHKIVDSLPEHIAVMDHHATIVFVNQAWKTFAGKNHLASENYGIGVNYIDLCKNTMGPEKRQAADIAAQFDALLSGRSDAFAVEYPCHSADRQRWFRLNLSWFMVEGNRWAVASHENITQRYMAEKQIRKLSQAVEHSPVSVVITDVDGAIEYVNPKFEQVTGYTMQEVLGRNPNILSTGKHPQVFYKNLWQTIKNGREWQGEFENCKKNREIYWESASISPIFNDRKEIISFVAIKEDITAQKQMIQDLEQAKIRAEAGVKAKNDFLATISHEIRTPMNAILGMSRLALDHDLSPDQHRRISHIQSAGKALMTIITDILDFVRMDAGNPVMKKEAFQFGDIMEKIITANESTAREKNIRLSYTFSHELPVFLEGDGSGLTRIIMVLTENALKYTSAGQVKITSDITFQDGKDLWLTVTVADTGIGMTKDQLSHLFEPFTQANGSSVRAYGGTGLGLAIVKQITDAMNGSIQVESKPGKGSVFTVSLPFAPSPSANVPSIPVETPADTRDKKPAPLPPIRQNTPADKKILIVDDDPVNREIVAAFLGKTGADISEADNGTTAVEMISSSRFHLVFMDLEMPGMDGYDTTRKIRSLPVSWASDVPIIALTGHDRLTIEDHCLAAGMNDCLTKPIDMQALSKILDKWLHGMPPLKGHGRHEPELIDMKAGLAYVDNQKPLYIKMLQKFTTTYNQAEKTLAAALRENDIQTIQFSARNLSSIGKMIGAVSLGESARTLLVRLDDGSLTNENPALLRQEVTSFCDLLKQVLAAAFSLLNTIETASPAVEKEMRILLDLIQRHQPAECREVLARLKRYDINQKLRQQLAAVESLVNLYRFNDAETKLALPAGETAGNTEKGLT
jgi:PAS domain S-box-containing protein